MVVAQWKPHVECSMAKSRTLVPSQCILALNNIPVREMQEVFGTKGEANVDVPLPIKYSSRQ